MTGRRIVAVAVDAAGAAGNRPYSYSVPDALAALAVGEAVLVEFGRRQALGIVLGPGAEVAGVETKPIVDRVRTDGPLLPELGMRLAAWIAERYLAPPALTGSSDARNPFHASSPRVNRTRVDVAPQAGQ